MLTLPRGKGYGATKEQQHRNECNKKLKIHTRSDRDDGDSCTSHTNSSSKNKHEKQPRKNSIMKLELSPTSKA